MREELIDILRCLECNATSLSLRDARNGQGEIDKATIVCKDCGADYKVESGIADFLKGPSESVLRERDAMDREEYIKDGDGKRYNITDENIERFKKHFLSMPEGDGSHFFKRGGSFQSIANGSRRFYSTIRDMNLKGTERVLEIGGCFSYASFKFAQKGCEVVSIDISNYLKVANLFARSTYFDRVFSDMHKMPFVDNVFDIVFGSAVLHHSKDLTSSFSEIHRVLAPGGKLVLINESARGVFEKVHPVFEKKEKQGYADTSYTLPEWKKGAKKAGFEKVKLEFLSLADDYIMRHKDDPLSLKLKVARFVKRRAVVEKILQFLLKYPRMFFRPKSWRMTCEESR